MTDDEFTEVTIERVFDAPRELVFECMTTPEHLTNFWGPPGVSTPLESITIEPRVGGVFASTMINDETGEAYPGTGVYTEFDPPARLAWRESGETDGMETASTFEDLGDGRTRVVIHQTNVPKRFADPEALAGFNASLDLFAAYLAKISAD